MRENEQSNIYDKGISINEMVITIYRYKWVIILATFLSALAMFVTSAYIMPKKYQSEAEVAIVQPDRDGSNLVPRIPRTKELAFLAQSDDIFSVVSESGNSVNGIALAGGDDQIQFVVTASTPEKAADIATAWMLVFIQYIEDNYSLDKSIEEFEQQLVRAGQQFSDANSDLENVVMEFQLFPIKVDLERIKIEYTDYITMHRKISETIEIAQYLDTQLAMQDQSALLNSHQSFSLLTLYLSIDNGKYLNLSSNFLPSDFSTSQARMDIGSLIEDLVVKQNILEQQIRNHEDEMIAIEHQVWLVEKEIAIYIEKRNKAFSNYYVISSKLSEAQQLLNELDPMVNIIRRAEAPSEPTSPNLLISTVIAGVVGLTFSTGIVFALEMWRSSDE